MKGIYLKTNMHGSNFDVNNYEVNTSLEELLNGFVVFDAFDVH